jgi:uncharacterized small protein (DUF1192 family)
MAHRRRGRYFREDRQKEAVERQLEHDTLSVTEKIAKAESRPGKSEKEIKRLETKLAKGIQDLEAELSNHST